MIVAFGSNITLSVERRPIASPTAPSQNRSASPFVPLGATGSGTLILRTHLFVPMSPAGASGNRRRCAGSGSLGNSRRDFPSSSVHVREDDVGTAQDGDDVGDLPAAHHLRERVEVAEGGGADLHPVRLVRAVRDEVDAEVTARG